MLILWNVFTTEIHLVVKISRVEFTQSSSWCWKVVAQRTFSIMCSFLVFPAINPIKKNKNKWRSQKSPSQQTKLFFRLKKWAVHFTPFTSWIPKILLNVLCHGSNHFTPYQKHPLQWWGNALKWEKLLQKPKESRTAKTK